MEFILPLLPFRKPQNRTREHPPLLTGRTKIAFLLIITLAIFVVAQLASLSIFGPRGKQISQIRQQQEEILLENETTKAKINELQSLERIERVATKELGMIKAEEIEYLPSSPQISANVEITQD